MSEGFTAQILGNWFIDKLFRNLPNETFINVNVFTMFFRKSVRPHEPKIAIGLSNRYWDVILAIV